MLPNKEVVLRGDEGAIVILARSNDLPEIPFNDLPKEVQNLLSLTYLATPYRIRSFEVRYDHDTLYYSGTYQSYSVRVSHDCKSIMLSLGYTTKPHTSLTSKLDYEIAKHFIDQIRTGKLKFEEGEVTESCSNPTFRVFDELCQGTNLRFHSWTNYINFFANVVVTAKEVYVVEDMREDISCTPDLTVYRINPKRLLPRAVLLTDPTLSMYDLLFEHKVEIKDSVSGWTDLCELMNNLTEDDRYYSDHLNDRVIVDGMDKRLLEARTGRINSVIDELPKEVQSEIYKFMPVIDEVIAYGNPKSLVLKMGNECFRFIPCKRKWFLRQVRESETEMITGLGSIYTVMVDRGLVYKDFSGNEYLIGPSGQYLRIVLESRIVLR